MGCTAGKLDLLQSRRELGTPFVKGWSDIIRTCVERGGKCTFAVDPSGLNDGSITSTLAVSDIDGNGFTVSGSQIASC